MPIVIPPVDEIERMDTRQREAIARRPNHNFEPVGVPVPLEDSVPVPAPIRGADKEYPLIAVGFLRFPGPSG